MREQPPEETQNGARTPFVLCPSCKNKLGQRRRDGAIEQVHAGRRQIVLVMAEITCEKCHMTMVFPAA